MFEINICEFDTKRYEVYDFFFSLENKPKEIIHSDRILLALSGAFIVAGAIFRDGERIFSHEMRGYSVSIPSRFDGGSK